MNYVGLASGQFFPGFVDTGLTFQDKRNRNPNWTDHEIVRFLEILQEDGVVKDLIANRNKKVFCNIAQRMCDEGAGKTWDQCRIKLKNLKSQYRYVKERIPNIDNLDLEDDDVVRQLISECQGRGISPSSIKHLRFLLRFLNKQKRFARMTVQSHESSLLLPNSGGSAKTPENAGNLPNILKKHSKDEAVSPPSSPFPGLKILPDPVANNSKDDDGQAAAESARANGGTQSLAETGYQFLEQFNRDMMDQFMEHQKRSQSSFARWEQERWRQERASLERWRQEAREHERQLFGMFCTAMAKCNAAITTVLGAKSVPSSAFPMPRTNQVDATSSVTNKRVRSSGNEESGKKKLKTTRADEQGEEIHDMDSYEDDEENETRVEAENHNEVID